MKPKKELSFQPDIELANRLRSRNKRRPKSDEERAQARDRIAHRDAVNKKELAQNQDLRILREGKIKETEQKRLGDPA